MGSSSVCTPTGTWYLTGLSLIPEARAGSLVDMVVPSRALRRDAKVTLYLPARFRRSARYPLLIVHDGGDYLNYAGGQDGAGQPHPPARRGRDRRGVRVPR